MDQGVRRTTLPRYHWVLRDSGVGSPEDLLARIRDSLKVSPLLAKVLVARGIRSVEEAAAYLNPRSQNLLPPESVPGLSRARDRLLKALGEKEEVLVHGDYDADGICGAVILHQTLKDLGIRSRIFLPQRTVHGYGLSSQAVSLAARSGIKLIVSVDCGISSIDAVEKAVEAGLEVLITDHHSLPEVLPRTDLIVHPDLEGQYPGGRIAGATVAYKLVCSLVEAAGGDADAARRKWLPLVALATVADVCDLTNENRVIVSLGMSEIPNSTLPGLKVLYQAARANLVSGDEGSRSAGNIEERDLAFGMAPVINAAGRMGNPLPAAKLLLSADEDTAWKHFRKLDELNRQRKALQEETCARLMQRRELLELDNKGGIVVVIDDQCIQGLTGIVASRLAEELGLPVCVLAPAEEDGVPLYRGSMRGSDGQDLLELMAPVRHLAEKIGGHSGALGVTVSISNLPGFLEECGRISAAAEPARLELDSSLEAAPVDISEVKELDLTRPWGPGNPQPMFLWGPVAVKSIRVVGKRMEHVQMALHDSAGTLCRGIAFNMAGLLGDNIQPGWECWTAGHFKINEWQGSESVEFQVRDLYFS